MTKQITSLLALFGLILMVSSVLPSCEKNQKPAYVGSWVSYDSTEFSKQNGLIRKTTYTFSESGFTLVGAETNNETKAYTDVAKFEGSMFTIAERMTVKVNSLSAKASGATEWKVLKRPDKEFFDAMDALNAEDSTVYRFGILSSKLTLQNEDTTITLIRQ